MNIFFLICYLFIPLFTCLSIKNIRVRSIVQLLFLLIFLSFDTYHYYSSLISEIRDREHGGFWPWGKAGITEEAIYFRVRDWSMDDYSFIDHLTDHHYFYVFMSGLAFYSYIYFFSRIYDRCRNTNTNRSTSNDYLAN